MSEPDESVLLLIPEPDDEGFQAGKQCHGVDCLKQGLGPMAFLQPIIRDSRAEMMDVMKADVSGEPLKHPR